MTVADSFTPTDPAAWLRLVRAPGINRAYFDALIGALGSVDAVLTASAGKLRDAGLESASIQALLHPDAAAIDLDLAWLKHPRRGLLTLDNPSYPALLATIDNPPLALYWAGDPAALSHPQIAIVGSRNPTASGRDTAAAFARHLAGCGLSVVSGLANGIDAAAHRGALAGGGPTVAVCGTGLDQVYPPQNRELAAQIAAGGVLISEFPISTPPRAFNFPRRNRIISGMAVGTLVVEAARRSGSLITAHLAADQGREVFAVPGSIHNPLAKGCHQLLREGAKLVESAEDILSELGAMVGAHVNAGTEQTHVADQHNDDSDYRNLLNALDFDPVSVDTLIERTGLTADAVSSMLLILELQGRALTVPGGRYTRVSRGKKNP